MKKKLLLTMKLALIIVFLSVLQVSANVYSQITVNLDVKDKSIREVLKTIEQQSQVRFFYSDDLLVMNELIDVKADNKNIIGVLDDIFSKSPLTYKAYDNNLIVIAPRELLQQQKVTGTVTDKDGTPLPGVNVVVTGTTLGAMTDIAGKYSIEVPPGSKNLTFSFVGMEPQEISIGTLTQINVTMAEAAIGLEEVVVIGYGVEKRVNVIGSIATVSTEEINSAPVSMVSNALAGRMSGIIVQQGSGEPGNNAANILIRGKSTLGDNSPLVVVDGIPGRDLNSIEPNDIASLTILKDASAGIYGAQAANGVILVETKRGQENTAPTLKYGFEKGWSSPTMVPKLTDAPTYAQMIREVQSYKNVPEINMAYSLEDIEKYKSGEYPWTHPNTNWYDAVLAKYTNINHHVLSLNGGTKNVTYYTSLGVQTDDGIYKANATSYNRYNIRTNLDIKINEYLSIGIGLNGSQEDKMYPTKSASDIFDNSIIRSKPTSTAVFPNGLPGPDIEYGDQAVVSTSFETGFDDSKIYRSQNSISATLKIPKVDGLSVTGYFAYDMMFNVRKLFQKPWTLYTLDKAAYLAEGNTGKEDGSDFLLKYSAGFTEPRLRDYYYDYKTTTFNIKANYDKTINNVHNINVFIAQEGSDYKGKGINAYRRYFISGSLPYLFAGGNTDQDIGSSVSIDSRLNYFGRLSYNFKETYLFQFSFRRDGSLRFSKENGRWGNFPSFLVGWRASNENFWKYNLNFINYFKLKASWGQMGNDRVNAFQYLTSYSFGTGTVLGTDKEYTSSLIQVGAPNPFITWEVANVFNIGFESNFLNSKAKLAVDYFYERRNNILVKRNASVPNFTGLTLPDENFGIVDNTGFEIVTGYADKAGDLFFALDGNFTFVRNKVVEFDEPERTVPWQVQTGHPQGVALRYKSIGVFDDDEDIASYPHVAGARPGDIIIEDYDKSGEITNDDRVLFDKTADPKIIYGVTLSLSYKNWAFTTLVQGVGNVMKDVMKVMQGSGGNYFEYDAVGRWTTENITADKPRAFERDEEYWRGSQLTDYWFKNMSYARLKNLQLSYTIPKNIQKAVRLQNAQLYFSGQNLFLIYAGSDIMDPELATTYSYPLMKVYSFGLEVTF